MKFFLSALFLTVFFMNAECLDEDGKIKAAHEACMPISGITKEMADRAIAGDFPEDMAFKKHTLCMCVKLGFMDEAGKFNMDFAKMSIEKHVSDAGVRAEMLSKCPVPKATPEETAFEATKCFFSYKAKMI